MMNIKKSIFLLCFIILSLGILNAQKQHDEIRILYFNDAHELNPVKTQSGYIGGVSRMKTVVDEIKKQSPDAVLIFGGDLAGGSLGGKLFRGSVIVESLNTFPVDYANFGQHEFDYGLENAVKLAEQSNFKWFTSNIVQNNGKPIPKSQPYIIHKKRNKTIGIIGITDKISTTKPSAGVKQLDLIESAKTAIKSLGKVDILVAVTQMSMSLNQELIDACPEVNLILSEETSQYKTQVDYYKNAVIIAACGNMGQLADISFSTNGKINVAVHNIDETVKENEQLKQYADKQTENAEKTLKTVVGNINLSEEGCNPTGSIVTDAYRWYYQTDGAIINGGGLRAKLPENQITIRDIFAVLPFENQVIPVKITGSELQQMMKEISERIPPQVSGITYEITSKTPKTIKQIMVNGQPLIQDQWYTIAVPDFVILGGNGITPTPKTRWNAVNKPYGIDSEILQKYLERHKQISTLACNRITITEK